MNVSDAVMHIVTTVVCLTIVGGVVGFHFGWSWGLASGAALWLLMPQVG